MSGEAVLKFAVGVIGGVLVVWALRYFFHWPVPRINRTDTTRFFKRSVTGVKLYSPPVLRCTLLVCLAAVGFTQLNVSQWQVRENSAKDKIDNLVDAGKMHRAEAQLEKAAIDAGSLITLRDYQLLKLGVVYAAFTVWVSFIDSSWMKAKDAKLKEDENSKRLEGLPG